MNPSCHVCSAPAHFLTKKDGFDEYLCLKCSLSFVYPQPDASWLKEEVYSFKSGYQSNQRQDLSQSKLDPRIAQALDFVATEKSGGTLLDVGCSAGKFMYAARKKGLRPSGVELNKRTADMARANGFEVHQGFLDSCPFPKKSFDVVYLGDVIEHVNDPRAFVAECAGFLKDDGIMAITTPNMDCLWSKATLWLYTTFGIPWSSLTPPHHLFQFSYGNLNRLLGESGWQPVQSFFDGPISLRYELGMLHLYGNWKKKRTVGSFIFMGFSYVLYTIVFGFVKLVNPLLRKRFGMATVFERPKVS